MKKILLAFLFFVGLSLSAMAQSLEQGESRFHGFGTYGLRWNEPGVGAGFEYFFADKFAIMPSFTFIFPEVGNQSNFSADLRYYVSEGPSQVYFLAGYSQNWENTQPDGAGTRRNFKGANVGVGAYIRLTEWIGISSEFKFQSQSRQEVGFRLGFAFPL
ncbi:outer membrane beta-barrel protein [Algoriphagus namhaensis]